MISGDAFAATSRPMRSVRTLQHKVTAGRKTIKGISAVCRRHRRSKDRIVIAARFETAIVVGVAVQIQCDIRNLFSGSYPLPVASLKTRPVIAARSVAGPSKRRSSNRSRRGRKRCDGRDSSRSLLLSNIQRTSRSRIPSRFGVPCEYVSSSKSHHQCGKEVGRCRREVPEETGKNTAMTKRSRPQS